MIDKCAVAPRLTRSSLRKQHRMNAFLSCPPIRLSKTPRRTRRASTPCSCLVKLSRRNMARLLGLGLVRVTQPGEALAGDKVSLSERFMQQAPGRPSTSAFGVGELTYPTWCDGTWMVESTLESVAAPAGYELFGNGYDAAMAEIGRKLSYSVRFLSSGHVPDRYYNVKCIAEATLGKGSVLSCSDDGASISIRNSDGLVYDVQLQALARSCEYATPPKKAPWDTNLRMGTDGSDTYNSAFYVSEFLRQSISLDVDESQKSRIREVETMTMYLAPDKYHGDGRGVTFQSYQRTAIYLPKTNLNYVDTKGKPIDVRWYSVLYSSLIL